jgi:hypothetical protein
VTGLARAIVGTWELDSYSTTSSAGEIAYPLGTDASGLILYTADGYMSAQIMASGRPPYTSTRVHGGTAAERDAAAGGYMAYSGPYRVDEVEAVVWHEVSVSLYPNWVGGDQKRTVEIVGSHLTLSSDPLVFRTMTLRPKLVWRRVGAGVTGAGS